MGRLPLLLPLLAFLPLLAGCGEEAVPLAPVGGTVTLNGEPAAGVRVRFLPVREPNGTPYAASTGVTDERGRYELTYRAKDLEAPGAVVGPHRVLLSDYAAIEARDPTVAPERIPPKYSSAGSTPLRADVAEAGSDPPAPQTIDFDADRL